MIHVLVGGKKRSEVLDNERRRLENIARESTGNKAANVALNPRFVTINDMEYELTTPSDEQGTPLEMRFLPGLGWINERGYSNFLEPYWTARVALRHFKEPNNVLVKALYDNMFGDHYEWMDTLLTYRTDEISIIEKPRNIGGTLTGGTYYYDFSHVKPKPDYIFKAPGLKLGRFIPLEELASVCPGLVRNFYNDDFDNLPPVIQTNGGLYLPHHEPGGLVVRGGPNGPFTYTATTTLKARPRGLRMKGQNQETK